MTTIKLFEKIKSSRYFTITFRLNCTSTKHHTKQTLPTVCVKKFYYYITVDADDYFLSLFIVGSHICLGAFVFFMK